jgi:hypothetical protein
VEENLLRAPQRRPIPAEVLVGNHLVTPGRLVPRARKEQDRERDNSCAILEELDREKDASGGAPQMIESGDLFVISPNARVITCILAQFIAIVFIAVTAGTRNQSSIYPIDRVRISAKDVAYFGSSR